MNCGVVFSRRFKNGSSLGDKFWGDSLRELPNFYFRHDVMVSLTLVSIPWTSRKSLREGDICVPWRWPRFFFFHVGFDIWDVYLLSPHRLLITEYNFSNKNHQVFFEIKNSSFFIYFKLILTEEIIVILLLLLFLVILFEK